MKKFFTIIFVSLGVIFSCLLLALAYFWIADPYNIKPFIYQSNTIGEDNKEINNTESSSSSASTDPSSGVPGGLTEGQQNALEMVGINPDILPSSLTPEQEQCFVQKFGQARVDEIKAGAVPTAMEVLSGKSCL